MITRNKTEKEHKQISTMIIEGDNYKMNKKYGSKENAEKRLQKLEHLLNYGDLESLF